MNYVKSKTHPGWIYSHSNNLYISPKGRLAEAPGAPFFGQVSEKDLIKIKEEVAVVNTERERTASKIQAQIIRTVKLGDITVNWIRASL